MLIIVNLIIIIVRSMLTASAPTSGRVTSGLSLAAAGVINIIIVVIIIIIARSMLTASATMSGRDEELRAVSAWLLAAAVIIIIIIVRSMLTASVTTGERVTSRVGLGGGHRNHHQSLQHA